MHQELTEEEREIAEKLVQRGILEFKKPSPVAKLSNNSLRELNKREEKKRGKEQQK